MAEPQGTGAASRKPDWPKRKLRPEEHVCRLQARIVKAEAEDRCIVCTCPDIRAASLTGR